MKSTMIPARWDTVSSPPRTRSSDAAKSSFQREQTSADCQVPAALSQSHSFPPPGKAPLFEESAQGRQKKPLGRGGQEVKQVGVQEGPLLSNFSALPTCGRGLWDQTVLTSSKTSLLTVRFVVGGDADAFVVGKHLKGPVT